MRTAFSGEKARVLEGRFKPLIVRKGIKENIIEISMKDGFNYVFSSDYTGVRPSFNDILIIYFYNTEDDREISVTFPSHFILQGDQKEYDLIAVLLEKEGKTVVLVHENKWIFFDNNLAFVPNILNDLKYWDTKIANSFFAKNMCNQRWNVKYAIFKKAEIF